MDIIRMKDWIETWEYYSKRKKNLKDFEKDLDVNEIIEMALASF